MKLWPSLLSFTLLFYQTPLFAQALPAAPVPSAMPAGLVGIVAAAKGQVQIVPSGQVGRVAGSGEPIYLGDEVRTDAKGNLQILLLDETVFTIGPNSAVVIDTFVYDPATHDGKIDARVVQGVFRFITGQIAHKKPSNVDVKLPTGSVGVRGTIFYGKVEGEKSTLLLLGPGEKNNTGHRNGRILVMNDVDGKTVETEVKKSGFGSVIEGRNAPPSPAYEIPQQEINEMIAAVNPAQKNEGSSDPAAPAGQSSGSSADSGSGDDSSAGNPADSSRGEDGKSGLPAGEKSATAQSGQQGASAASFLQDLSGVTKIGSLLSDTTAEASLDIGDKKTSDDNGGSGVRKQATFDELRARTETGVNHYQGTGTLQSGGSYSVYLDIDFGNRHFGGGNSRVEMNSNQPDISARNFSISSPYSYSGLNGDAVYSSIPISASVVTGTLSVRFFNRGDSLDHTVSVAKGGGASDSGSGQANLNGGPAPT